MSWILFAVDVLTVIASVFFIVLLIHAMRVQDAGDVEDQSSSTDDTDVKGMDVKLENHHIS